MWNTSIKLMQSNDYKERFIAEYWQTKIRYEKLKTFNNKIEASTISNNVQEPIHDCPLAILKCNKKVWENIYIL